MANRNSITGTNDARLQSASASTTGQRNHDCCVNMDDENDVVMQGDDDESDNNSVPTTMGVRASLKDYGNRTRSSHRRDRNEHHASNDAISVAGNTSFFIPLPIPAGKANQQDQQHMNLESGDCEDDISTLTEYSMEENEDDNLSQTTANTTRTFVTDATGSTNEGAPKATRRDTKTRARRLSLANKRTRMQQCRGSSGNPSFFRESNNGTANDQPKRRRRA
eukprot:CAMPEP_0197192614 /NCGR_PEP_ID=MMETSP1423-20130617/25336_1 /TAXON_ID=476441 /ORGANISM="Pseudo-nitzschia heimii, Strain UNC1101" /LENGTH=221 /DNA_ID=CAMNT_0042645535 /DNA_START=142 /DNA_END=807 /DNA_ORIENTATION=-